MCNISVVYHFTLHNGVVTYHVDNRRLSLYQYDMVNYSIQLS